MSAIPRGLAATAQKRSLVEEIKESPGVTKTMARAPGGDRFTQRERADLARRIQPYDHDADEEALQ